MNLVEVVGAVPKILMYIIPGYIVTRTVERFRLEKHKDSFNTLLYSLLYSYIIGVAFSLFDSILMCIPYYAVFWSRHVYAATTLKQLLYLVLSIILSFIIIKLPKAKNYDKVYSLFNPNLEQSPSVWKKALECKEGAWVTVYLNNGLIYKGKLSYYTVDSTDEFQELLLTNFILLLRNENSGILPENFVTRIDDHEDEDSFSVLLERKNITSIEISCPPIEIKESHS